MLSKHSDSRRAFLGRSLLAAGAASSGALLGDEATDATVVDRFESIGETSGVLYKRGEGPWGKLSYFYFYLEAPEHLIDFVPLPPPRTRWSVPVGERSQLVDVVRRAPLTDSQRQSLTNPDNSGIADGVFSIFPPAETLESMTPEARASICSHLARYELNPYIRNPVRIRSGSVDEWTEDTGMRPELVELMKRMVYFQNGLMLFSDFPHLIGRARSETEARALHKTSSRTRSMLVRLDTKEGAELDEMLKYWSTGLGLRRKEIEHLLVEAVQNPGVDNLDLAHILPPLPRKLLFTYPDMSMANDGILPDCHWSSLNFFNYNPQPIYLDEFFAASRFLESFEQVDPPYRYGDVMVFLTDDMSAYHSCVYIAGDIVYTKNGRSLYQPWILLPLQDVASTYVDGDGKPLRVQGFRKLPG